MTNAGLLLAALALEAAAGYPRRWPHPVQAIGAAIEAGERMLNRGGAVRRRLSGVAMLVVVAGGAAGIGHGVAVAAGTGWGLIAVVAIATTGLAQRSLDDHVRAVLTPLARGDLAAARGAAAMIVGRDVEVLDEAGVATAAIESLAESFCDGVVMPAFWFLLAGLPGLAAAKAINTADSIVGHRTARLAAFGWAAARADDVAAFVPARIAGLLICVAAGGAAGRAWTTMRRNARTHASPNGGWPEAAMAGALGRRLGGPVSYDGEPAWRATLGTGALPDARDLARALRLYRTGCLLLWGVVGVIAWGR